MRVCATFFREKSLFPARADAIRLIHGPGLAVRRRGGVTAPSFLVQAASLCPTEAQNGAHRKLVFLPPGTQERIGGGRRGRTTSSAGPAAERGERPRPCYFLPLFHISLFTPRPLMRSVLRPPAIAAAQHDDSQVDRAAGCRGGCRRRRRLGFPIPLLCRRKTGAATRACALAARRRRAMP